MPYADVNNVHLYYDREGSGPPLILITGFGGDIGFWRRASEMLSEKFTLIKVDNRGSGNTIYKDRFTLDDIAEDVRCLTEELGFDKISILGWSMGSHIAQKAAVLMPEKITALILVSSYRYRPSRFNYIVSAMVDAIKQGMPAEYLAKILNGICYTEEFFKKKETEEKSIRAYSFKDILGLGYQIGAMGLSDVTGLAAEISVPTLIIHGSKDITVECEEGLRLAETIPGCKTAIIEGAGHHIPADEYVPHAVDFIEQHMA
ncbi:MAG: alpha/beta hydrolase [Methanomassiliicoccaceae archaeon]|nr:alpha/beta hydrolase [Methanomassiliicoccaceae archaeon]MCL2146062.1 alpha/beta hydrolase [Methanomassiliicoccaceae archaeon]